MNKKGSTSMSWRVERSIGSDKRDARRTGRLPAAASFPRRHLSAGTFAIIAGAMLSLPAAQAQAPADPVTVRALQERIEILERRLDALTKGQSAAAPRREPMRTAQAAPASGASG